MKGTAYIYIYFWVDYEPQSEANVEFFSRTEARGGGGLRSGKKRFSEVNPMPVAGVEARSSLSPVLAL